MIIGNQQAQETVAKYFQRIQDGTKVTFPFVLLSGPQYVGKTSIVEKHIHDLVGLYGATDYLPLYDLSEYLGKAHTLKVEVPAKDQRVTFEDEIFVDMGTRDVVQWLSLSPVGSYKVVFLENIERMTVGAANAFLKTFEEPLPNRLIVATTSNQNSLLDTIVSRAFLIPFQIPSADVVATHLTSWYPEKSEAQRLFAASFSLGRLGMAKSMLDKEASLETMSQLFMDLVEALNTPSRSIVKTHQLIQQLQEYTGAEQLLDALLYAGGQSTTYAGLASLMQSRSMLQTNVHTDNILFDLALR